MDESLKLTLLNRRHRDAGAKMADFGGYEMPLWYETGVKTEHMAVLTSAGLFDTSHMACISLEGDGAFALLNFGFTRNLDTLKPGRCVYGAFLDEKGHCLDDAIVYRFSKDRFMVCVNAGMGGPVASHLEARHTDAGQVRITDLSGKVAKIDVQGKNAARILAPLLETPDAVFDALPYFSFKGEIAPGRESVRLTDGTPVLISRSGYTGEFGFELFIQPERVVSLWDALLEKGKAFNLIPCGLGARDSLRAGACLPLSHQDIGDFPFINHPWDFALPFNHDKTGFTKNFLGAEALLSVKTPLYTHAFAGDSLRKVGTGEATRVLGAGGSPMGRVLTCATDMSISWVNHAIVSINTPDLPKEVKIKGLSCGFIMVDRVLSPGSRLTLQEGKRSIEVTVVADIRPDRTGRRALKHFI